MLISIIIPIYNVSDYIERCLYSVLNQTYKEIEIILVNDATIDDSMIKVKKIFEKEKNINVKTITHPLNKGLSAARNTGVKNSTGDYIYFLDSDDELPPRSIELLTSYLKKNFLPDIVMGEMMTIGADRERFPKLTLHDGCVLYNEQIVNSYLKREWYEMACNKLVKRDLFFERECLFCEGILHEDTLWSFNLAAKSHSLVVCRDVSYYYYIHTNSITQKKSVKNFDSMLIVMEQIIAIRERIDFSVNVAMFSHYIQNLRIYLLKSAVTSSQSKKYIKDMLQRSDRLFIDNNIKFYSWRLHLKWWLLFVYIKYI